MPILGYNYLINPNFLIMTGSETPKGGPKEADLAAKLEYKRETLLGEFKDAIDRVQKDSPYDKYNIELHGFRAQSDAFDKSIPTVRWPEEGREPAGMIGADHPVDVAYSIDGVVRNFWELSDSYSASDLGRNFERALRGDIDRAEKRAAITKETHELEVQVQDEMNDSLTKRFSKEIIDQSRGRRMAQYLNISRDDLKSKENGLKVEAKSTEDGPQLVVTVGTKFRVEIPEEKYTDPDTNMGFNLRYVLRKIDEKLEEIPESSRKPRKETSEKAKKVARNQNAVYEKFKQVASAARVTDNENQRDRLITRLENMKKKVDDPKILERMDAELDRLG